MSVESAYPPFPPPTFTEPLDGNNSNVSTAQFEQIRNAFEVATLNATNVKPRFNQAETNSFQGNGNGNSNYENYEYSTGTGNTEYESNYGDRPPPFIPQQLQPDPSFSNPTSPYLGVSHNRETFSSPNSNSNGSNYQYDQGQGQTSPNLYSTGMNSPSLYGGNPYANNFGNGFNGSIGSSPFLVPGMIPTSPGLGPMSPQFGMGGFPMMDSPSGMLQNAQAVRTVYVGNLPADASVDELLSQVRFGPIDSVKILPEKSCAFISFLDPITAAAFHSDALMRKIRLHEQDLKIGWGKPSTVPANVVMAVQQSGATRNVYLGNLPETVTEQTLRDDLSRFGPIDQVKIVRDKNIGFVHFLSIATSIKVVSTLATEVEWSGRRVAWGKDRCAYVPKNQHQQQQHNLAAAARGNLAASYGGYGGMGGFNGFGDGILNSGGDPNAQPGNRTVYLGNVHPETTTEEICNTIRGGILQQIRYIPDKHICFVTFVEAQCALAFFQTATFQGIALHNRRLKVGWGKHSGPPSPGISMVVQSGGSRNVYVGNIDDFEVYTEEKLRSDFGEYGEIELINTLKEKQCAFVNFTNIANAIKAIEAIKSIHPDYAHLKIAYGKDRAGNPPRSLGFAAGMAQQQFIGGQSEEMYDTYVNEMSPIEGDEAFAVVTTEVGLEETLAE